tara:strand:- start:125 stop:841 length:717 start_codon:yes stop_codon:yes gene_type:complete
MKNFDANLFLEIISNNLSKTKEIQKSIGYVTAALILSNKAKDNSADKYFNFKTDIKKNFAKLDKNLLYTRVLKLIPRKDEQPYVMLEYGILSTKISKYSNFLFLVKAYSQNHTMNYTQTYYNIDIIKNFTKNNIWTKMSEKKLMEIVTKDFSNYCKKSLLPSNLLLLNNGFNWNIVNIKKICKWIMKFRKPATSGKHIKDDKIKLINKSMHLFFLLEKNMHDKFNFDKLSKNEKQLRV